MAFPLAQFNAAMVSMGSFYWCQVSCIGHFVLDLSTTPGKEALRIEDIEVPEMKSMKS